MKTFLILLAVLSVVLFATGFAFFAYVGASGPETFVVTGARMNRDHVDTVRELGLLEEGEQIKHFYSDALLDIREGMYFVTDRKLVLYDDEWAEPVGIVPLEWIVDVELERDESFWVDSYITISLVDGDAWGFPVSSERGGDQHFYDYLVKRVGERAETAAD